MRIKKILSLLLVAALGAGLAMPTAAAAPTTTPYKNPNGCTPARPCKHSPVIVLPGINQSQTHLYVDGERTELGGGTVFPDMSDADFVPLILSMAASLILQRDVFLHKSLYNFVAGIFEPQRVGLDGKHVNDLRTEVIGRVSDMDEGQRHFALNVSVPAHAVLDIIGDDHMFFFGFNLVGCVWENVDLLEEYIDYVREKTGHNKVSFANVSLGGTLFTGYIEKYGYAKLDQVINVVSCGSGTSMFADLFAMDVDQDPAFLYYHWIPTLLEAERVMPGWDLALGHAANLLIRVFPNDVFHGIFRAAWSAVLDTVMLNCTQFWAMIPAERYPALAERYLSGPEHAVIRERTDRFHQAQLNLHDNVRAAHKAGVHINNIAGSGLSFGEEDYSYFQAPASRDLINGDGIIDVALAGMGVTAAPPGQTLPAGYKPLKPGYISPCRTVDASTAVLPDNTWIFLNQHHEVGRNDAVLNLVAALYLNPGMNIHTDPKNFPQYQPGMRTNELRRWAINDAERLIASGEMAAADERALRAAVEEGKAVRTLTVGDPARASAVTQEIIDLLIKYGWRSAPEEKTSAQYWVQDGFNILSWLALNYYGNRGYSEGGSLVGFWRNMHEHFLG